MGDYLLLLDGADTSDARLSAEIAECGFSPRIARNINEALRTLQDDPPLLILIRTDDGTALPWCRFLHLLSTVPILVLCTERDEQTIVRYLEAGADSVLLAPLSRRELEARFRAVLAGAGRVQPASPRPASYRIGDLVVDAQAHAAAKAGRHLPLTPTEFRLLVALARRAGQVVSHRDLLTEVWGSTNGGGAEKLRLYVGYLRRKLDDDPKRPHILLNCPGVGYRLGEGAAYVEGRANGHVPAY